jgi:hypothetical protein
MFKSNALLEIQLMPQRVVLTQERGGLRGTGKNSFEIKSDVNIENCQEWAIETCRELLAQKPLAGNLSVTFSDLWTRYDLIQLGEATLSEQDAISLARTQFSRHYPNSDSDTWPLRLSQQGKRILVAGMNPLLLDAIKQLASTSGKRLVRAEPLFSNVFDQYEKKLATSDGWILFDEPGMLIAAFMEQGQLSSIHSQRCNESDRTEAAQLLLERQAVLIARPAGAVRIFSFADSPLVLNKPWTTSQLHQVGRHPRNDSSTH